MTGLAVAADDRTGALETAAACADAGFTTRLHTHPAARYGTLDRLGADVVDLRTRHATPGEARIGEQDAPVTQGEKRSFGVAWIAGSGRKQMNNRNARKRRVRCFR